MKQLLLILACLWPAAGLAAGLTGEVRWRGEIEVREPLHVEAGAVLRIEPGTTVRFSGQGGLEVAGRLLAREATLTGENWPGLVLKGTGPETLIADCTLRGAQTGILVAGGAPRIEGSTFSGNRVGVELRQQSDATISGCEFTNNDRVGLFVKDGSTAAILNNHFTGNGKFGVYLFRSAPRRLAGNVFNGNATGLMVSHFGSDPLIEYNCLTGNQTAILVDKAARPTLRHNDIRDNQLGVDCYRRSDPLLESNRISGNRTGVKISFSSYPVLHDNDLSANDLALYLEFQSASWEQAKGADARAEQTPGAFGARPRQTVSEEQRRPNQLEPWVDARNNWWGDAGLAELRAVGESGNPGFIDDGRDRPDFSEGAQSWPLDRVRFAPWRTTPIAFEP